MDGQFWDFRLLLTFGICALVNILTTTASAARASAVLTKRVATSLTIFNLFQLISRLANLVYVPVMGSIVDKAAATGALQPLEWKMRIIILGATLGCIIGSVLMPTFIEIYIKAINQLEKTESMPKVLISLFNPRNAMKVFATFRKPSMLGIKDFNLQGVPSGFLIFNVFMTAVWTIGVLCAAYASAMVPELARTATLLSGLVNGLATIMFTIVVDPTSALITDQIVHGMRPQKQIYIVVVFITLGNIAGTILAQFFLLPGAQVIAAATRFIGR